MSDPHEIPGTAITLTGSYALPADQYKRRAKTLWLVVHCADTAPTADIGAADIRKWHVNQRGWIDIGYHFVIRRSGNIERGRPAWAVGAGVEGFNATTLHICLAGGRNGQDDFAPVQKDALRRLIVALREVSDYRAADVCGHRDFPAVTKLCPGFDVKAWISSKG